MTMTLTAVHDPTLPPRYIVESYQRAFRSAHGRDPQVRYMGNHWYHVNGETVHRLTLIEEIGRLEQMERISQPPRMDKSIIQRLIARIRSL